MSTPPSGPPAPFDPPSGRPTPPGYYPQEAYYAPGWTAPVPSSASVTPPPRRRWPLVLGLLAVFVVVLAIVVASLRTWADQQPLGEVSGTVSAHPRQLTTGHCVESLPADGALGRVDVVPCAQPHEAEVIAVHVLDGAAEAPWPGRSVLEREAARTCEMDTAQKEAGARAVVWTPSEAAWGDGERRALCLAWSPDGGVTGSWTDGDVVVP